MAKKKTESKKEPELSRDYIIPLRKQWRKVANYKRTGRAIREIKKFIAKHMKVPERDVSKVKLDLYLNQEVWFRGKKKPPAKIKVKAVKEGDLVKVFLAEPAEHVKFLRSKLEKKHKAAAVPEKAVAPLETTKEGEEKKDGSEERKPDEKTEEEKNEEKEKSTSAAEQKSKVAETQSKQIQKATSKSKQMPIQRKALKK